MKTIDRRIQRYRQLLEELDDWFRRFQARHSGEMQCSRGCARCCHGLFDISPADAMAVAEGFGGLEAGTRSRVDARASVIQEEICRQVPELERPYLLHGISQDRIDRIVDSIPDARCPFLNEDNECLIYDHRPLACRLEGIPMVDAGDGLFGDWCDLNFTKGLSREIEKDARLDYYEIQKVENADVTIFVPSVIAGDFMNCRSPRIARIAHGF